VIDIQKVRADFPILEETVNGKPLVYFDNAATTQKPLPVLEALANYYGHYNANIHRGIHFLAEKATSAFEASRLKIQQFLNAARLEEIIFTYGTTDGINLVAQSYGRCFLKEREVLRSSSVPWSTTPTLCLGRCCVKKMAACCG
jgi:cysteine desulfurase/selenocysteine lyase